MFGSSIPSYLLSFSSFFLSQCRQLLDTWWNDRESSCLLDTSLTPGGLIEKAPFSSKTSRHLVDRSSFYSCVFALFINTFLIAASVDVVFLNTCFDRCHDTSRHLYLLRFTEPLYIGSVQSGSHFSRSLS